MQSSRHTKLARRLWRYNALLDLKYNLRVRSIAVLLRPEADSRKLKGALDLRLPDGDRVVTFHYLVIRAWEQPVEPLLTGALATLPIFLVWTYIAWSLILFGAELTAAVQRGDLPPMLAPSSPDFLYSATMHILIRLADRAYRPGDDVTSWTLARELFVGESAIKPILDGLKAGGFVIEADPSTSSASQGLFLARQASTIVLADAIKAVAFDQGATDGDPRVDRVLAKMGAMRNDLLKTITLEDIRSAEAKAAERETAAIENKADQ